MLGPNNVFPNKTSNNKIYTIITHSSFDCTIVHAIYINYKYIPKTYLLVYTFINYINFIYGLKYEYNYFVIVILILW